LNRIVSASWRRPSRRGVMHQDHLPAAASESAAQNAGALCPAGLTAADIPHHSHEQGVPFSSGAGENASFQRGPRRAIMSQNRHAPRTTDLARAVQKPFGLRSSASAIVSSMFDQNGGHGPANAKDGIQRHQRRPPTGEVRQQADGTKTCTIRRGWNAVNMARRRSAGVFAVVHVPTQMLARDAAGR